MAKHNFWDWIIKVVKAVVFVLVAIVLYRQIIFIFSREHIAVLTSALSERWWYAAVAVFLFSINYLLEVLKWWVLTHRILGGRSFTRLLEEVFSGAAMAIVTPNRIGAFVGRMVYFKPEVQLASVGLNVIGSLSQLLATVVFGLFCVFFIGSHVLEGVSSQFAFSQMEFLLIGILVLVFIIVTLLTFRPLLRYVKTLIPKKRKLRWLRTITSIRSLDNIAIVKVCLISFLRLMVYSSQFLLLILFAGAEVSWTLGLMVIGFIYFLQSIVPLPSLFTLVLRGELAIWLFSQYGVDDIAVLLGSYLIWFVNLGMPALIGLIPLMKYDIKSVYK